MTGGIDDDTKDPDRDESSDAPSCYTADGVDVSLIRWMLSLTPAERLEFLQQQIDDITAIRERNARMRWTSVRD